MNIIVLLLLVGLKFLIPLIIPGIIIFAVLYSLSNSNSTDEEKKSAQTMWYTVGTAYFLDKMFNNKK